MLGDSSVVRPCSDDEYEQDKNGTDAEGHGEFSGSDDIPDLFGDQMSQHGGVSR
jgi:hypothetical protein